jgi:hypothetical protein
MSARRLIPRPEHRALPDHFIPRMMLDEIRNVIPFGAS